MPILKTLRDAFLNRAKPEENAKPNTERKDKLKPYLQDNGSYLFNIEIERTDKRSILFAHIPNLIKHSIGISTTNGLFKTSSLNESIVSYAYLLFDLKNTKVFFKEKNSDIAINGNDKNAGFPSGTNYQIILIPEECTWEPKTSPVIFVSKEQTCKPRMTSIIQPPHSAPTIAPATVKIPANIN